MPSFPSNFEPSKESMHKWFGTRKKAMVFGAVELPGVFQTYSYSTDTIRISILMILEILGAVAIMIEGEFSIPSIVPIIFAIIVDIFLAVQLHSYVPKRLEYQNQAKATDDPALAQRYVALSKQGKISEFVLALSIYLIGILKGVGYMLFVGELAPQVILLFIIFLIISALHISTTGYWVAENNLRSRISKEVQENILSTGKKFSAQERISVFISDKPINLINTGLHSLIKGKSENQYTIKTVGVLTDQELASMVAAQPNVLLQTVVATACIKHQMQNILLGA